MKTTLTVAALALALAAPAFAQDAKPATTPPVRPRPSRRKRPRPSRPPPRTPPSRRVTPADAKAGDDKDAKKASQEGRPEGSRSAGPRRRSRPTPPKADAGKPTPPRPPRSPPRPRSSNGSAPVHAPVSRRKGPGGIRCRGLAVRRTNRLTFAAVAPLLLGCTGRGPRRMPCPIPQRIAGRWPPASTSPPRPPCSRARPAPRNGCWSTSPRRRARSIR